MDDFDRLIEIQRMTASKIRQEAEVDNKVKLLGILSDLASSKRRIQVEEVIIEAGMQGMSEGAVMSTLNALKLDRLLSEPEPGIIKLL